MFRGKKKGGSGLPDLPPVESAFHGGEDSSEDREEHSLPSFPDSQSGNRFSEAAIKEAVDPEEFIDSSDRGNKNVKIVEMEEWSPSDFDEKDASVGPPKKAEPKEVSMIQEDGEDEAMRPSQRIAPPPELNTGYDVSIKAKGGGKSDVFVKIDKFHSARRALKGANDSLKEISELMKKIREMKLREEQELAAWEKDVANVKARIRDVTENIFEKVD
jgi:hypothetical protein